MHEYPAYQLTILFQLFLGSSPPPHGCSRSVSPERRRHIPGRHPIDDEHMKAFEPPMRHSHSLPDRVKEESYLRDGPRGHPCDSHGHPSHSVPYVHLSPRTGAPYYNGHKILAPSCHRSPIRSRGRNHRLSPVPYISSSRSESSHRDSPQDYDESPRHMKHLTSKH